VNYETFKTNIAISKRELCRVIFREHADTIQIKTEETVVRNLEKIFDATLKISNRKGFQAMSMRDLSRETGLSLGALYSYFPSKDKLLAMLQNQRRGVSRRILEEQIAGAATPWEKFKTTVRVHLYLSEALQPWFYFSYMEAKNLDPRQQRAAIESELFTDGLLADILEQGALQGHWPERNHEISAGLIKAMLQDWYLKRGKHKRRRISVDQYAETVIAVMGAYYHVNTP